MNWTGIKKFIKYRTIYFAVLTVLFFSRLIPRRWWLALFGWLGKIAFAFPSTYRQLTILHLGMAYGTEKSMSEIYSLAKRVFQMIAKNGAEVIRSMNVKTLEDLSQFLEIHGFENFEMATAKGKGVMFLTCHLGAFDLQITAMSLRGLAPNIIGTALKDKNLNRLLSNYRNSYGAVAVERGKENFRLIKALKSNGQVAILIDQDTKVKSRFVNFFGMPASTPVGAAILAIKTKTTVLPTYIYLGDDNKQHMHIMPAVDLTITGDDEVDMVTNTQKFTSIIEDIIRAHPEQWVWMHERWKTKKEEII